MMLLSFARGIHLCIYQYLHVRHTIDVEHTCWTYRSTKHAFSMLLLMCSVQITVLFLRTLQYLSLQQRVILRNHMQPNYSFVKIGLYILNAVVYFYGNYTILIMICTYTYLICLINNYNFEHMNRV